MQGARLCLFSKVKNQRIGEILYYQYYEYPGAHSVRRHYGVRTDRYKLIHFYMLDGWELYDLKKIQMNLNSL